MTSNKKLKSETVGLNTVPGLFHATDETQSARKTIENGSSFPPVGTSTWPETQGLIHKLQMRQAELELQNDELRRTQIELEASRTRYFDIYDLAPASYFILNEKGNILEVNLTAADMLGLACTDLLTYSFSFFILDADREIYDRQCKQLVETGSPQGCDLCMKRKDDSRFLARLEMSIRSDAHGACTQRVLVSYISKRNAVEERALREDGFLQGIQDSFSAHIVILDRDGVIVHSNAAWRKFGEMNGLKLPNHGLGLNYLDFCASANGEHSAEGGTAQAIQDVLAGVKKEIDIEYPCDAPNEKRWFVLHISKFESGGQPWMVLAHKNITERKQGEERLQRSEAKYRMLTESMKDVVWTMDADSMHFLYISPSVQNMCGFTPEEMMAAPVDGIFKSAAGAGFSREAISQQAAAFRAGHNSPDLFYTSEFEQPCKNGSTVWVEHISNFYFNVETGHVEARVVTRDISARKQTEVDIEMRANQMALITDIGREIATVLSLQGVLDIAAKRIHDVFGFHLVALFIIDRKSGELVMRARADNFTHIFPDNYRISQGVGMVGWTGKHGKHLLSNNVEREPQYKNHFPELPPTRSELSIPLIVGNQVVGVLDTQSPMLNAFRQEDVSVLATLADLVSVAIGKSQLFDNLQAELASRKLVDASLYETNDYLENLFNYASVPIIVWDAQFKITRFNHAFENLTGRNASNVLGKSPEILFPPAEKKSSMQKIHQMPASDQWEAVGINIQHQNGSIHTLLWNSANLFLPDGNTRLATIVQGLDITKLEESIVALKKSFLQLESQKQFISSILESIPSSLVVINRSMRVVSVNHNFLEKTRRDEQMTLGHRMDEIWPQVLLDYTHLRQRILQVFRGGAPVEGSKVVYRASGLANRTYFYRLIPIFAVSNPSGGRSSVPGHVENVLLLMDDMTEREQLGEEIRRIERHLAGVVDCANDLVVSLDHHGRIVTWNRAAQDVSGINSEYVKGRTLVSVCISAHQPAMNYMLGELMKSGTVQHAEANLLTAKSTEVPIAWSCSLMRDDAANVAGVVAVGRDLTDRRRMEDKLSQSAAMASLGIMAGGIAHELRNPLGIISASAQLLMEFPRDLKLRKQGLEKIHASTRRASLIIENLLKFARPAGDWTKKAVNLRDIINETLLLLDSQIKLHSVVVSVTCQPDLPPIAGSHEMLLQVFTNLILNACNAMPGGGSIKIVVATDATGLVDVSFMDSGHGISPENLSKLFDPFFTTMPVGKGVGLGLSVSHTIIQQHHGMIEVQSELGKGSNFIVRLPRTYEVRDQNGR